MLVGCVNGGPTPQAGPVAVVAPTVGVDSQIALPNKSGSLKFAVLGDFGTGEPAQYQMAVEMAKIHERFPFDVVVLVGDNLYGAQRPQDFKTKFEVPYKPLLDTGVKFYAALGNHDDRNQRFYQLFNMGGKLYYSMKAPKQSVRFFFLDSTYPDPDQLKWLDGELKGSGENWKIPIFHHPLYSSGQFHGSDLHLREIWEPLFVQYNVSTAFAGHDHIYERVKPQQGVAYFVVGSGGQLRPGNLNPRTGLTAKGFDTDNAFMVAEIDGDNMYFNAVSRTGKVVDSGIIGRRQLPK